MTAKAHRLLQEIDVCALGVLDFAIGSFPFPESRLSVCRDCAAAVNEPRHNPMLCSCSIRE
jgi:hypothetical protein